MKLPPQHRAALAFALLIACVLGCKSSGSSTSSTTTKTDAPRNANNSTAGTSNPPAPVPDIAGKYNVAGSNPNGARYKGTLDIFARGDVYQFRWNAGTQYDGVGVTNGNFVAVSFANGPNGKGCGVIDYNIQEGVLDGKWGYWGVSQSGTEKAERTSGSALEGDYDATGKNPDGKEYKARLRVEPAGNLYRFVWSNDTDGVGILQDNNVAVGIGGARCGFVAYEIKSDGTLDGIWGGYGSDRTGTEKATKQ